MSEITRTEKFLRACIDGEPCALKPLTRVEKLLAELNETLAGGGSASDKPFIFNITDREEAEDKTGLLTGEIV